jgi:hypothetical protein
LGNRLFPLLENKIPDLPLANIIDFNILKIIDYLLKNSLLTRSKICILEGLSGSNNRVAGP